MSFTCGFYNSQDGDRVYSTSQISDFLNGLVTDGVYQHINDGDHYGLQVVEQTPQAMGVYVSIGKAWFNSTWSKITSPEPVTISGSSALLNRIDAICLTVNKNRSVRNNYFEVISGTETSGTPEKPTVVDEPNIYRHVLAWVTVNAGVSRITNANIERNIGTDDVPFVKGIIDAGVTVDQLNTQWKAEFMEWFDYMKDQLTEDAAGNLQTEIDEEITNRETAVEGETNARIAAINELRQDFTDGCNAIANALIAQGITPVKAGTNYTPTELIDSIMELFNSGRAEAPAPNIEVKLDGYLIMYYNSERSLSTVDPLRSIQIIDNDGYTTIHNVNTSISSDSDSGYPKIWEKNYTYHYPGARNTPIFPSKQEGEAALQLIGRGLSVLGTSITKSVSGNYYSIQDIVDAIIEIKDCGKQYPLTKDYSFYLYASCNQALLPRAQFHVVAYKDQTKRERWDIYSTDARDEIRIDGIFATLTIPPVS